MVVNRIKSIEKLTKGLESIVYALRYDYIKDGIQAVEDLNDAIELLKSQELEIEQLKQQQINTTRRIEQIIEQHCYLPNWYTQGMVDGLRIALEIMSNEQNKAESGE